MKNFQVRVLILMLAVFFFGCSTTIFKPFEAKVNEFEGEGGTKEVVDGMEVWDYGSPPKKFKILGMIDDQRPGGIIPMSQLKSDIVAKAREAGGDAVVQVSNNSQFAGTYSTGFASAQSFGNTATAYGSGVSVPIRRNISKFAVIQYLE